MIFLKNLFKGVGLVLIRIIFINFADSNLIMVHPVCLIILQLFALYCIFLLIMTINGEGVFYEILLIRLWFFNVCVWC